MLFWDWFHSAFLWDAAWQHAEPHFQAEDGEFLPKESNIHGKREEPDTISQVQTLWVLLSRLLFHTHGSLGDTGTPVSRNSLDAVPSSTPKGDSEWRRGRKYRKPVIGIKRADSALGIIRMNSDLGSGRFHLGPLYQIPFGRRSIELWHHPPLSVIKKFGIVIVGLCASLLTTVVKTFRLCLPLHKPTWSSPHSR